MKITTRMPDARDDRVCVDLSERMTLALSRMPRHRAVQTLQDYLVLRHARLSRSAVSSPEFTEQLDQLLKEIQLSPRFWVLFEDKEKTA